jgi:hypothetical protein
MRLALLIVAAALAQTARGEELASLAVEEVIKRARAASVVWFRTGEVAGRFEIWARLPDEGEPTLQLRGQFVGVYDKPKLRVDFELSSNRKTVGIADNARKLQINVTEIEPGRRTILYDGKFPQLFRFDGEISARPD